MHYKKSKSVKEDETTRAGRLIAELMGSKNKMEKYGSLIRYMDEKHRNGTLEYEGWGKVFSRLNRMKDGTWEETGNGRKESLFMPVQSSADSRKAEQYVKSMLCDDKQFDGLILNLNAAYEDRDNLKELRERLKGAKRTGEKLEMNAQEWLAAQELVDRVKNSKPQQRSAFFEKPKAEPARVSSNENNVATASQRIKALLGQEDNGTMPDRAKSSLKYYYELINHGNPNGMDWENLYKLLDNLERPIKLKARIDALLASGKLDDSETRGVTWQRDLLEKGVSPDNLHKIGQDVQGLEKKIGSRSEKQTVKQARIQYQRHAENAGQDAVQPPIKLNHIGFVDWWEVLKPIDERIGKFHDKFFTASEDYETLRKISQYELQKYSQINKDRYREIVKIVEKLEAKAGRIAPSQFGLFPGFSNDNSP